MPYIGIDLGGTKLASAIFTADGDILHRESVPLDGRTGDEVGALVVEHLDLPCCSVSLSPLPEGIMAHKESNHLLTALEAGTAAVDAGLTVAASSQMLAAPLAIARFDMVPMPRVRRVVVVATVALVAACSDASPPVAGPDVSPSLQVAPGPQASNAQLAAWFNRASPAVLTLPGTVFADHDERGGKLVLGVENKGAVTGVRSALTRLSIPSSAYEIRVVEPVRFATTLRDPFRPTQAGIQIHFGRFLCTMGFNVSHAGGRSFVTNSHCTNKQGGTEGTQYWQPLSTIDPTVIATEADDPEYFRGGDCPQGRRCRYSDASRAAYSDAVASSQGVIARTTGANNGSVTVDGAFTISDQDNTTTSFELGTVANKIGRTSGWTQGEIVATCVHTNVFGSNITQLCQTFVSAGVAGGDSGSPVFVINGGRRVTLVGILWGGSGSSLFVFSPLKQIRDELGAFTATAK